VIPSAQAAGRRWQTPVTCGLLALALVWQTFHGVLYIRAVRTPLSHCHPADPISALAWTTGFGALALTAAAAVTAVLAARRARSAGGTIAVAVLLLLVAAGLLCYDVAALHADFVSGSLVPYACD
jgi:hypothetical protein